MSKLIIAEKPSVAKSIASALGASSRANGFYEGNGLIVSWCVGHLVSPLDAGGYDERFKKWRYDDGRYPHDGSGDRIHLFLHFRGWKKAVCPGEGSDRYLPPLRPADL